MYELPTTIQIGGQSKSIRNKGDFRMVLDCFSCLNDEELDKNERVYATLMIFYDGMDSLEQIAEFGDNLQEAVDKMFWFFNCQDNSLVQRPASHKLIDWDQDSQMICAAVNKVAGKEVRMEPYVHWWTFMGYYMGIGESLFSTVVNIRDKMVRGTKLEKHESKFKRENPQYFVWNSKTVDQREADEWLKQVWNADK